MCTCRFFRVFPGNVLNHAHLRICWGDLPLHHLLRLESGGGGDTHVVRGGGGGEGCTH